MKNALFVFFGAIAGMIFALSLTVLCHIYFDDGYLFDTYAGPYPDALPAGHCLVTDGTSYATRGIPYSMTRWPHAVRTTSAASATPAEAIDWAWTMRESYRKDKYEPRPKSKSKDDWRPANPELCKEGKP